jgi:cbb3-type cytochrome oxidase cytochrome c subunit
MRGLYPLFLGLFATFAFSWIGLALIPNAQIGHLDPQSDEEGTEFYPVPKSGMADRGRKVFTANGCYFCHSQQIRPNYIAADTARERDAAPSPRPKWADRRSAPRDYIFERPVLLGKMRMGPDLSSMGKAAPVEDESAPAAGASPGASPAVSPGQGASPAAQNAAASPVASPTVKPAAAAVASSSATAAAPTPMPPATSLDSQARSGAAPAYSAAWHHRHLYAPRGLNQDSNMPSYRFIYTKRRISGERAADALVLTGTDAPPDGYEIVPSYEAECLVAYLMSLDQSHPLKEVKSYGGAPAAAPAPAVAPGKAAGK